MIEKATKLNNNTILKIKGCLKTGHPFYKFKFTAY